MSELQYCDILFEKMTTLVPPEKYLLQRAFHRVSPFMAIHLHDLVDKRSSSVGLLLSDIFAEERFKTRDFSDIDQVAKDFVDCLFSEIKKNEEAA